MYPHHRFLIVEDAVWQLTQLFNLLGIEKDDKTWPGACKSVGPSTTFATSEPTLAGLDLKSMASLVELVARVVSRQPAAVGCL